MQPTKHAALIEKAVQSDSAAAQSRLAASWRRSLVTNGLDPANQKGPVKLGGISLAHRRQSLGLLMSVARPNLDQLFTLVGGAGCCVLLTDSDGVVVDRRATDGDATTFDSWGLANGAIWSEATEGTNGIGTCIVEKRQVSIHGEEHFHTRNTAMSCMDAPIFGPDGRLVAALDVSSCRSDRSQDIIGLIANAVSQTAARIEGEVFQATFPHARMLTTGVPGALLAVNADDLVIGATRAARKQFGLGSEADFAPRPTADLLGHSEGRDGLESAERAEIIRTLARARGNASAAARALGIGRATLYRRMKQLGISPAEGKHH